MNVHADAEPFPRAAWNRATWGPIMMGALAAIGLQFVFTTLGFAIGLSSVDGNTRGNGDTGQGMGIAASAWWLITGTISLMAGGWWG